MKMITAIVRPEREEAVVRQLEEAGLFALTKWDVLGRGRQRGVQVGATVYHELPKVSLMLVVEDEQVESAVEAITAAAQTGHPGDGRIFVGNVDASYIVRTGRPAGVGDRASS